MLQDITRNHTAIHEAGHAILAHVTGNSVGSVTLRPKQLNYAGLCVWRRGAMRVPDGKLGYSMAVIGFAGFWSEIAHFGKCNGGATVDFRRAARRTGSRIDGYAYRTFTVEHRIPHGTMTTKYESRVPYGLLYPAWRNAWETSRHLCATHHAAIECLAESLLIAGEYKGDDIKAAIQAAMMSCVYDVKRDQTGYRVYVTDLEHYRTQKRSAA